MSHGLRTRLALTHVLVAVIAIAAVATIIFLVGSRRFDTYLADVQSARSDTVVQSLAKTYTPPDGWDAGAIAAAEGMALANNVNVAVYDPGGTLLFTLEGWRQGRGYGAEQGAVQGASQRHSPRPTTAASAGVQPLPSGTPGQFTASRRPVVVNGVTVGTAEVFAPQGGRAAAEDAYLSALSQNLLIAVLVAVALAIIVSLLVSRHVTGPLEELTGAAQEVARGNLDVRVTPHADDEVGALAVAFNGMAGRLAQNDQWRRDMTADLAHELRTPLATIQARIEALEDGVLPATPGNLRVIGEEVERLGRLLGALRNLNELESADATLQLERLDLADIGRDACARAEASYLARNVTLTAELRSAMVDVDRDRLLQVAVNLLDNALKYTPSGGRVVLAVGPGPGSASPRPDQRTWAHLSVSDSGPGIDPADLPFVFDRFYRAQSARTAKGAGLGLAIVRALTEAHGGVAAADKSPLGGARFTVALPLAG